MAYNRFVGDRVSLMPQLDILRSSLYDGHLLPLLQL
jgi:hypothetical protein